MHGARDLRAFPFEIREVPPEDQVSAARQGSPHQRRKFRDLAAFAPLMEAVILGLVRRQTLDRPS
jgi:hypothetical protein